MWWSKFFGNYRYKWLVERKKISLLHNISIDEIYILVFSSVDFSKKHTVEDYEYLKEALILRYNNCNIFSLALICIVADKLSIDSPYQAWEIVYLMLRLGPIKNGSNRYLMYKILQKLEDTIGLDGKRKNGILSDLFIIENREDSFLHSCYIFDVLRRHLNLNIYPSVIFSDNMKSNITTAMNNLRLKHL